MRYLFIVAIGLSTAVFAQNLSTTEQLINVMHDHYAATWYHTLTFEQESITHKPDGTKSTELWQEAMLSPGRLRIDMGDPGPAKVLCSSTGASTCIATESLSEELDRLNPLLVLGFDVYRQPGRNHHGAVKSSSFRYLGHARTGMEWTMFFVVGAKPGDLHSAQFWIDKEHLYFVRMLQPDEKDSTKTQEFRFDEYRQVQGGGWLAEHVSMYSDGKLVFEEKYSKVRINPGLSKDLFDPQRFSVAR